MLKKVRKAALIFGELTGKNQLLTTTTNSCLTPLLSNSQSILRCRRVLWVNGDGSHINGKRSDEGNDTKKIKEAIAYQITY
jgi:hypothetical protein